MATSFSFFNSFKTALSGKINLATDTLKVGLATSAQALTTGGQSIYADITAELTTADGYTVGGATVTNKTWTQTSGTAKLDFDDVTWNITGAGITCRYFFIYSDTATNKDLIGFGLLDDTPANVTVPAAVVLTLVVNTSGLFTEA